MRSTWWYHAMRPLVRALYDAVRLRRSVAGMPVVLHGEFLEWDSRMVRVADAGTWHEGRWVTPKDERLARWLRLLVDHYSVLVAVHENECAGPSR